jgi:hypothetical protein
MRLLAVAPVDHPGGAEIHLLRLLAGLRARGWETALTTPGRGLLHTGALVASRAAASRFHTDAYVDRVEGLIVRSAPGRRRRPR